MDINENNFASKERFTEIIEAEFATVNQDMPPHTDPDLLAYRLEVATYLRDALYALPIPDELMETACNWTGIINQTYLYWTDEASRGTEVVDKLSLAFDCAKLWLGDVRAEYRCNLLYNRIGAEYEEFMAAAQLKRPLEIISDAWKIVCYDDVMMMFEHEEIPPKVVDALLTMESPLFAVYEELRDQDSSDHMNGILDAAQDIADLQHESILDGDIPIPENPTLRPFFEEYLAAYGGGIEPESDEAEIEP